VGEIVRRALGVTLEELRQQPRKLIQARRLVADFLLRERLMPPREIAVLLGVKQWQASALARAGEGRDDPGRAALVEALNP
jgi:hypothetical protein